MLPVPVSCPNCTNVPADYSKSVVRFGHFRRRSDQRSLQRYRCLACKKTFSEASFSRCRYQKKRHLNAKVFELLVGGFSQRRSAKFLRVNRKTIIRKFLFLGKYSYDYLLERNNELPKALVVHFDDLETFEHSKCKPLSVIMAVEEESRRILGFKVAQMPAKGHLAKIARKKYGFRVDKRAEAREALFRELKEYVESESVFKSDQNPHYGPALKKHFPRAKHMTYKGRRGCVVGQGELKAGGFDPLFSLNHTYAMLRANINRLFRRTWCTTKLPERLAYHISLYCLYHNLNLIQK